MTITLGKVTIVDPGGNITAIIWDTIPEYQHVAVSLKICQKYQNVEQVMYVQHDQKYRYRGQMAGDEFCDNAIRSLGYLLLSGNDGQITLETSCCSGAVGLYLSLIKHVNNQSISYEYELFQPSGICLFVKVVMDKYKFLETTVSGPVSIIYDGPVKMLIN